MGAKRKDLTGARVFQRRRAHPEGVDARVRFFNALKIRERRFDAVATAFGKKPCGRYPVRVRTP
jgi:hypothetical protein